MKPRSWSISLLISVLLHVILLGALGVWFLHDNDDFSGRSVRQGGGSSSPGEGVMRQPREKDVENLLQQKQSEHAKLTPEDQMDRLERSVKGLSRVSKKSVRQIVRLVEQRKGVNTGRKYEPDPDATGEFDTSSAVLYEITRKMQNGESVYEYTLVDADGRSLRTTQPASQVSSADRRAQKVFDMARKTPLLRELVDSAIRIADKELQE